MIRVTELRQTCEMCPSQWEGRTDDGRYVYIRYRHGSLTVDTGQTMDDAIRGAEPVFEHDTEDGNGYMSEVTLRDLTRGVVEFP